MKLMEALSLKRAIEDRVADLKERIICASQTVEGVVPPEDPTELLVALDADLEKLAAIRTAISLANCRAAEDGVSMNALMAALEKQTQRVKVLRALAAWAHPASQKVHVLLNPAAPRAHRVYRESRSPNWFRRATLRNFTTLWSCEKLVVRSRVRIERIQERLKRLEKEIRRLRTEINRRNFQTDL